jgi:hypothetical protein
MRTVRSLSIVGSLLLLAAPLVVPADAKDRPAKEGGR